MFDPPIDLASLPGPVQRICGPAAPAPLRAMAARGAAPGLKPDQVVTVVALLARAELAHVEPQNRESAESTLGKLPAPILAAALASPELPPGVIDALASVYASDMPTLELVVMHPAVAISTIVRLAKTGDEQVTELVATNEERLLEHTDIATALYMNRRTRMSTADRVLDLAVRNGKTLDIPAFREAAEAIKDELVVEAGPEPTPDDVLFKEAHEVAEAIDREKSLEEIIKEDEEGNATIDEKALPLEQRIRHMTVSQKIRTAMLGSSSARALLVRDKNRLVAQAVIRSPLCRETEIAMYAASRAISEDVLRLIASNGELTKSHAVKINLVTNPKTPLQNAMRLLPHLRTDELKRLTKSKNVSAQIAKLARQEADKRKPGG